MPIIEYILRKMMSERLHFTHILFKLINASATYQTLSISETDKYLLYNLFKQYIDILTLRY